MSHGYQSLDVSTGVYARGCRGKIPYGSKKKARGHLRVLLNRGVLHRPDTMGVYNCDQCRSFHIGHFNNARDARASRG